MTTSSCKERKNIKKSLHCAAFENWEPLYFSSESFRHRFFSDRENKKDFREEKSFFVSFYLDKRLDNAEHHRLMADEQVYGLRDH